MKLSDMTANDLIRAMRVAFRVPNKLPSTASSQLKNKRIKRKWLKKHFELKEQRKAMRELAMSTEQTENTHERAPDSEAEHEPEPEPEIAAICPPRSESKVCKHCNGTDHCRANSINCLANKKHMELDKDKCKVPDCPFHCGPVIKPDEDSAKTYDYMLGSLQKGIKEMWHCRVHLRCKPTSRDDSGPCSLAKYTEIPEDRRVRCGNRFCKFGAKGISIKAARMRSIIKRNA